MIKKSIIGLIRPKVEYEMVGPTTPGAQAISAPMNVTLLVDIPLENRNALLIKAGEKVKEGQKLTVSKESDVYVISTVTGEITAINPFTGDRGKEYTAIDIKAGGDEIDDTFSAFKSKPALDNAINFLECVPGKPDLKRLNDPDRPIKKIVVAGMDPDLLVAAKQYAVRYSCIPIKKGIEILKKITGINDVVLAVPPSLERDAHTEMIDTVAVSTKYPSAIPRMIVKDVLGQEIQAGVKLEDMGICFISAESIAAMGDAYKDGKIPNRKLVTIINKDLTKTVVSAVIGTPVGNILAALDITTNDQDRIIAGGPMRGSAVYAGDYPIQPDTDAIMIQDKADIPNVSDSACINCGECIRTCPVNVPVNLLVRFLEAGEYEEAADDYDLYSCVECGLCSFVCTAEMPIFQFIRLAKHELVRIQEEEAEAEAAAEAAEAAEAEQLEAEENA